MSQQREPTTQLGKALFRAEAKGFGIRRADLRSHLYLIGKTGTGKSTLLERMVAQEATGTTGAAVLDPHGSLVGGILKHLPADARAQALHLDVPDPSLRWTFNPLAGIPEDRHAFAVAGLVEVFRKLWTSDWGPRLEHLLRNVVFTLLENEGTTLADALPLLTDRDFRASLLQGIRTTQVRSFWKDEFDRYSPAFRAVVVAPLQNKLGALLTDPVLRRILTGPEHSLDLRSVMDEGRLLLVNLDKGRIGEGPAALLGSLLVSHLALAGFSRSDTPEEERRDFALYLDEFHTFTTLSLASMLSELRKYRVALVLAHQYLGQLDPAIRDAVFGNAGTILCFRPSAQDAEFLAREFAPKIGAEDLINLDRFHFYIRLMIEGTTSSPFLGITLPPNAS